MSAHIAFFGSSLVSTYWNGAATYYRGIVKHLHRLGHRVRFYEPDAFDRQAHRDIADPDWAEVVVYPATDAAVAAAVDSARDCDVLVKASGVGVFDTFLAARLPAVANGRTTIFWDVDAPATLARLARDAADPFHSALKRFDFVLTYGGGDGVVRSYRAAGARGCVPVYNALDPDTHFPTAPERRFEGALGLLANRLPDREQRVQQFFVDAARALPHERFVLGGNGWHEHFDAPPNVAAIGHVPSADHNAFNSSPRAVLNVNRDSMAAAGFSPATRVFEAAGAAACLITDAWRGIEAFLEPGREVLVARDGREVAAILRELSPQRARAIGAAARRRVLAQHTYAQRAALVDRILHSGVAA